MLVRFTPCAGRIVIAKIYFQMHLCYELVFDGRLHLSPITSHPQNVLDIGTGRGDWAIDFAEYDYPPSTIALNSFSLSTERTHLRALLARTSVRFNLYGRDTTITYPPRHEFSYDIVRKTGC